MPQTGPRLLSTLPDDARQRVLAAATRRKFAKNEVLFHEGDPGDALHMVEKGHVAIRVSTPLGDVATLNVMGPGDAFGEQALLGANDRRTATAVALDPVETRVLHRDAFEHLVAEHPATQRLLLDQLAAQVRRLSARLSEALYVAAETRVLRRLLELCDLYGSGDGAVTIPLTQDDLATMAGTTRPTANRVLKPAEEAGVLILSRGRVEVIDRAALERRAR